MENKFNENVDRPEREEVLFDFLKKLGILLPVLTGCCYVVSLVKTYFFFQWYTFDIFPFLSFTDVLLPNFADVILVTILFCFMLIVQLILKSDTGQKHLYGKKINPSVDLVGKLISILTPAVGGYFIWINRNDPVLFRYYLYITVMLGIYTIALSTFAWYFRRNEIRRARAKKWFPLIALGIHLTFVPALMGWNRAHDFEFKSPKYTSKYQFENVTITTDKTMYCIATTSNYIVFFHKSDRSCSVYKMSDLSSFRTKSH